MRGRRLAKGDAALTEAVSIFGSCSIQDGREDHISESAVANKLPIDACRIIVSKIGCTVDLMAAASVCRDWRAATANPDLWRDIVFCGSIIERLTDSRLESILKRADGQLEYLCIQTFGNGTPVRRLPFRSSNTPKMVAEFSWKAPLTPNILPLILHASRGRHLYHLDLRGCLEIPIHTIAKFLADCPEALQYWGLKRDEAARQEKIGTLKVAFTDNDRTYTLETLRASVNQFYYRNCGTSPVNSVDNNYNGNFQCVDDHEDWINEVDHGDNYEADNNEDGYVLAF